MSSLKLTCLFPLALLLASCGHELPATDGVLHLDLRLADGSSPSSALASTEVRWVEELLLAYPATDMGSWSTQYCLVDQPEEGRPGMALIGNVPEVTRMKRIELRSGKTYAANEIDFVELELAHTTQGIARVAWRSSLDSAEPFDYPRAASILVPATQASIKLRIPLASQPGWVGDISELSIAPKEDGMQRVELISVRLGRTGFSPGPDALGTGPAGSVAAGDGGLIALGREARRAWPSDWNVPLFARAHVPRGGRLGVDAGVSTNTTNVTAEVRFRIDARASDSGPWQRVGSTSIVPGMSARGPAWEHMSISLASFAGQDIQLRFLADEQGEPNEGGKLDRARLYWGEPLIEGDRPENSRPSVLLITLDSVRADAIGAMHPQGGPSPTPFLDSLAARGILFEQAWSASNATAPSHASLMTGLAVQDHGLADPRAMLAPENVTLAESFRAAGWQTAAAVSVPRLTPGKSGLGQGFDRFWLGQEDSADDGAKTIIAVRNWLRAFAREGPRPTFLWVHLFDAHTPYDVPQAFLDDYAKRLGLKVPPKRVTPPTLPANRFDAQGAFLADVTNRDWVEFMYRACVAYEDELLSRLFAELEQHGGLANTFVAIIADHGEALGEHDNFYHHSGLYREVMHVPMLVVAPSGPHGVRVKDPVWSLDLSQTLFKLSGQTLPQGLRGTDLLEFVGQPQRPQRRIFFEHAGLQQLGCSDEQRSAIYTAVDESPFEGEPKRTADTLELFDSALDSAQIHDLGPLDAAEGIKYRELFSKWRESALNRASVQNPLTPGLESRPQQLGY